MHARRKGRRDCENAISSKPERKKTEKSIQLNILFMYAFILLARISVLENLKIANRNKYSKRTKLI